MKIAIVGCGGQGSLIAARLSREKDVEQLILIDKDIDRAEKTRSQIETLVGKARLELITKGLNINKSTVLSSGVRGVDMVFNATFPPFNIPIMKACLEVGAHYSDLWAQPSSDLPGVKPEETIDAQLELNEDFKDAELTAIPCTGAAPGFTDCAARYIADKLDTVDTVKLKWGHRIGYAKQPLVGIFAPRELMGEFFSPPGPVVYEKGKIKVVDLLESEEEHDFPEPTGKVKVYTVCTHPEIKTIPLSLSKIGKSPNYVELKGGLTVGNLSMKDIWIKAIRQATTASTYVKDADLLDIWGATFIPPSDVAELFKKGEIKEESVGFQVELTGTRKGKFVRHTIWGTVSTDEAQKDIPFASTATYATSIVPTIITLMVCRGEIKRRGVLFCGDLNNTETVLKQTVELGMKITERIEGLTF